MKKVLYILVFVCMLFANAKAEAEDIESTRQQISNSLNTVVKELKQYFSSTDGSLNANLEEVKTLEEDVTELVKRSGTDESNPTVLKHGKASIYKLKGCDYNSENLHWTGSEWKCQTVDLLSDCIAANDEYRVDNGDGSYSCQKSAKNSNVDYYWDFTGYSVICNSTTAEYSNVYGCFYKNKVSQIVQVDTSNCSGKSKSPVAVKTCNSDWVVGAWGACNKSCGGGIQTRSITCPSGKVCLSTKPEAQQACNTQVCSINPTYSCPSGYSRSGNSCVKSINECKYSPRTITNRKGKYEWVEAEDNESGATWDEHSWNGRYPNPLRDYYRGKYMKSFDGSLVSRYIYQICRRATDVKALVATCPSGYRYNSSTKKCH